MMKFGYLFALGATGVYALPQLAGQGAPQSLEQALEKTVATLEALAELRTDLEAGAPDAVERIRRATEAPALKARERDELLVRLRGEVAELHMQVDGGKRVPVAEVLRPHLGMQTGSSDASADESARETGAPRPDSMPAGSVPTVGMDDELRRTITNAPVPLQRISASVLSDPGRPRALEPEGYSADLLRQGRLFFQAERYREAITLLEPISTGSTGSTGSTEARYWLARSFERLGRQEEAIEHYRELSELTDDPATAKRARHDLDFLEWKRDFLQKRQGDK